MTHPRDRCARLDLDREDRRGECSAAFGQGARGRRVDRRRRDANCEGLDEWIRHVGTDGFLQYLEEAGLPADLLFNLGCGETSMMVLCWSRFGVSFASTSQRHRSNRGGRSDSAAIEVLVPFWRANMQQEYRDFDGFDRIGQPTPSKGSPGRKPQPTT